MLKSCVVISKMFSNFSTVTRICPKWYCTQLSFAKNSCWEVVVIKIATTKVENLRWYKIGFSLTTEQILAFASSPRKVKHLSPNFKQIAWRCFKLLSILLWIFRSSLSLNSKQLHQNYAQIACIYSWYSLQLLINKPGTLYFFEAF